MMAAPACAGDGLNISSSDAEKKPSPPPVQEDSAREKKTNKDEAPPISVGDYLAGRMAEAQGDTKNGLRYVEEAVKSDPENKTNLSSLYRMYILSGSPEKAEPIAVKLLGTKVVDEGSEFSPEMFLTLTAIKKGEFDKAESYLKQVPKAGFNNVFTPLLSAWIKQGKGEVKAPLDIKDISADQKVTLPHIYVSLAYINDLAGFTDHARVQYDAAIKDQNSQTFRAVQAAVNFYDRSGDKKRRGDLVKAYMDAHGESHFRNALLKEPEHKPERLINSPAQGVADLIYLVAGLFHGVRAPADEVASLQLAMMLHPGFDEAQYLLASAYELQDDYTSAIAAYNAIPPASPFYRSGQIRGLYDKAESNAKYVDESLAKLEEMAAQKQQDIEALLAKGDILRMHNRYKEAIDAYTAAAGRISKPEKAQWVVYFSRGACYERIGEWGEAEADMKKALAQSPGEPDVLNYLGYSWLTQNQHMEEAKKMIEEAYEARPEDPHIIDSMGFALYMTGDYSSAQEYFQQALERTPDDPTVNDHLGDTHWQLGHKTEAKFQWKRALTYEKDPQARKLLERKLVKGIPLKHSAHAADDKKNTIELPADE